MSPKMIYLVPGLTPDGKTLRVKDPITFGVLPSSGDWKPETTYWIRRLRDGDVLEREAPPAFKEPDVIEEQPALVSDSLEEPKEPKKKKRVDAPKED